MSESGSRVASATPGYDAVARYGADGWAGYLGVEVDDAAAGAAVLRLPFMERHHNAPDGVIHGGILATLLHDAAWLAAADGLAEEQPVEALRTVDCDIAFLRAARETGLVARADVLRQGRRFTFVSSEVRDAADRLVATARCTLAIQSSDAAPEDLSVAGEGVATVPDDLGVTPMGESLNANMGRRVPGLAVSSMGPGLCRIHASRQPASVDWRGEIAPGIVLLAADNTAVFASFELHGAPAAGSTVDLRLAFCEPAAGEDLVVMGRSIHRNGPLVHHWTRVEGAVSGRLKAYGTVTYLL